jgi:hypothetical protein
MNYAIITLLEALYLFYMYFFFKTKYSLNTAILDKTVQLYGPFFLHNTGSYENKICLFGKFMAIIAIILAWLRLNHLQNPNVIIYTVSFDLVCLTLAFLMNTNAFIYLVPLVMTEIFVIQSLHKCKERA